MTSIRARHTVSGKIAEVPEHIFFHAELGRFLEAVDEDTKPYLSEMHIPREAEREELDFEEEQGEVELPEIEPKDNDK